MTIIESHAVIENNKVILHVPFHQVLLIVTLTEL